jgi:hypothetical protein
VERKDIFFKYFLMAPKDFIDLPQVRIHIMTKHQITITNMTKAYSTYFVVDIIVLIGGGKVTETNIP